MGKTKKVIESVKVFTADGLTTTWTRADDGLGECNITETNILILDGPAAAPLMIYAPTFWLSVETHYSEIVDDKA